MWWAKRHDVLDISYPDWLVSDWLGLGGEFLFLCLALLIVMGLARRAGGAWWLPGAAVLAA